MQDNKKRRLVPYTMVERGFEAVYTGETSSDLEEKAEGGPHLITQDDSGNVIEKWSTWTWTFPGEEEAWNEEIKHINEMQARLGPFGDKTRQMRAHIGSLVLCDSGVPVTIDELLQAIGRGELREPSFHNGCWLAGRWWDETTTQPFQDESMQAIYDILTSYLAGKPEEELVGKFPHAKGFIGRTYQWLGPAAELTEVQKLMMERMLLPFEFFTKRNPHYEAVNRACFEEGGRGAELDAEISALAGLPRIYPDYLGKYHENLNTISDPEKQEMYRVCCHIAHGLHGVSDCHHSSFRWIENWIHGIGAGKLGIPTRKAGTERERLAGLLFGYILGLDKWLLGKPMQFLLLDLGHVDLGFDPKNEILRVYAYLGEEKTPVKEWLAACLWHNLAGGGSPRGLVIHESLLERAREVGISVREWMDSVLGNSSTHECGR